MLRVCLAGATGWAGSELARGIARADDLTLVGAVSRSHAGKSLGDVLGEPTLTSPVSGVDYSAVASRLLALGARTDVYPEMRGYVDLVLSGVRGGGYPDEQGTR